MTTTGRRYVLSASIALVAMVSRVGWIDWAGIGRALAVMLGLTVIAAALALLIALPILLAVGIARAVLALLPEKRPARVSA